MRILNAYQVSNNAYVFLAIAGIFTIIALIFLALIMFDETINGKNITAFMVSLITACGLFLVGYYSQKSVTRYEVILEDGNLQDIYEKYKVIEQRGEIWVLEEKEAGK